MAGYCKDPTGSMAMGSIDREIKQMIDGAYNRCADLINANIDKLHQIADYLLAHETMDGEEFEKLFAEPDSTEPALPQE